MTTYIDTSVVLRLAFHEPDFLAGWKDLKRRASSRLTPIEALRTLDRRFASGHLGASDLADRRAFVLLLLDGADEIGLSEPILERAENPFPTPLRPLDALHLATALALARQTEVTFATHDAELAIGARAVGLRVIGT